eukprot:1938948-Lingulodinium_polyedra.AAC.1
MRTPRVPGRHPILRSNARALALLPTRAYQNQPRSHAKRGEQRAHARPRAKPTKAPGGVASTEAVAPTHETP